MAQQWAKMAANLDTHPKVVSAGRNGREVFLFVLRRVADLDTQGVVPSSNVEPRYLARILDMPEADAENGICAAIHAGLLERELATGFIRVCGWDANWSKKPSTNAERQAKHRNNVSSNETALCVTNSNDGSVTQRYAPLLVTPSNGSNASEKSRVEEIREEKREGEPEREKHAPRKRVAQAPAAERATKLPPDWEPTVAHDALARSVGADCAYQAIKMREWAGAKGERKVDWNLAFNGWLRRIGESATQRGFAASAPARPHHPADNKLL